VHDSQQPPKTFLVLRRLLVVALHHGARFERFAFALLPTGKLKHPHDAADVADEYRLLPVDNHELRAAILLVLRNSGRQFHPRGLGRAAGIEHHEQPEKLGAVRRARWVGVRPLLPPATFVGRHGVRNPLGVLPGEQPDFARFVCWLLHCGFPNTPKSTSR
jgi:hypothetical protein